MSRIGGGGGTEQRKVELRIAGLGWRLPENGVYLSNIARASVVVIVFFFLSQGSQGMSLVTSISF